MIHALVTERIHFNPTLLKGAPPEGTLWNEPSQYDLQSEFTPEKSDWHGWLGGFWQKYLNQVRGDPMSLLERPPASQDRQTSGKTLLESLPGVLLGANDGEELGVLPGEHEMYE